LLQTAANRTGPYTTTATVQFAAICGNLLQTATTSQKKNFLM